MVGGTEVAKTRSRKLAEFIGKRGRWYMKYFSSYLKIVRMIGWMLRFTKNARCLPNDRTKGELSVQEVNNAEKALMRMVQSESIGDEKNENTNTLGVFKYAEGLLRVKTKIVRRADHEDFRCPILLPSDHPLVSTLVRGEHLKSCLAGVQILLSSLREKFWILKGRTIRSVLLKCLACRRYEAKKAVTIPAPLPEDRVRDALVFEIIGVDLAGPLYLKGGSKAWIVLLTCANYRALHLELITSLSTDAFLQGFRRFIARRGRPSTVYSDNGTNFVGANNLFKSIDWEKVKTYATVNRIRWKFNPPTAAWCGGWGERLVRMVKEKLRRVLGRTSLNYEELMTTLCDCESLINSRPLTYLSEYTDDLVPLTPAMFLQDVREAGVPGMDVLDSASLNKRFRYRQRLRDDLRQRFRIEYLGQLVQRAGEKGNLDKIKVGDIVLVGSDNVKRLDWPMGKVIEVFLGKDNKVRVVRVKTSKGELIRPIQRVYPMELSGDETDIVQDKVKVRNVKDELDSNKVDNVDDKKVVTTRRGRAVKAPNKLSF